MWDSLYIYIVNMYGSKATYVYMYSVKCIYETLKWLYLLVCIFKETFHFLKMDFRLK